MKRFIVIFFVLGIILFFPATTLAYYTNMPATLVLGQTDFVSSGSGVTASKFNSNDDVFIINNKLFLSDGTNNRVLIWNKIPTQNNTPADIVLGQPDFVSSTANNGGVSASTLSGPSGIVSDGTKLIVADANNRRILVWNTIPTGNKQPADVVIGQPDFATTSAGTTASKFGITFYVVLSNGKLILGDNNRRVLIYNSIPTTNGASADVVIGQTDMTTGSFGGLDAAHFGTSISASVRGLAVYGNKLIIADNSNQRVLIYNSIPTVNGVSADVVIGQPNFTSNTPDNGGISCGTIEGIPGGISVTPSGRLLISDNGRLLIFNQIPGSNFQTADLVLGKPDCFTRTGGTTDKLTSTRIRGVIEFNQKLYVSDASNNRILIFPNTITTPQISLTTPPTSIGSGRYRLTGSVSMNNNGGTYSLETLQVDLNSSGYGNITFAGGRSDGSGNTTYDFIYDFDPSVGGGDINSNLTLKFLASTFNADTNTLFYFLPFKLKSVTTNQIVFNVNKNQLSKIKDNISHFEVWIKSSTSSPWTKYIDNILPSQIDSNGDVYLNKTNSLTSTSYKVKAVDNWNNSQESNVLSFPNTLSSLPLTLTSPLPTTTPFEEPTTTLESTPDSVITNISENVNTSISNFNLPSFSVLIYSLTTLANKVKPIFPLVLLGLLPLLGVLTLLTNLGGTSFSWNLISKILQAFGLLPKGNASGTVYDTKTGNIVPFAVLTLTGSDGVLVSLITDSNGVYHGVNLTPGTYSMKVAHHEYEFPTKEARPPLVNIKDFYKGENFSVSSQEEKQFLIVPMDGRAKGMGFSKRLLLMINSISKLLFLPMLVFSTLVVAANPTPFNILIASIYTLIFWYKVLHLFSFPTL